jgi:hypothetical protein
MAASDDDELVFFFPTLRSMLEDDTLQDRRAKDIKFSAAIVALSFKIGR